MKIKYLFISILIVAIVALYVYKRDNIIPQITQNQPKTGSFVMQPGDTSLPISPAPSAVITPMPSPSPTPTIISTTIVPSPFDTIFPIPPKVDSGTGARLDPPEVIDQNLLFLKFTKMLPVTEPTFDISFDIKTGIFTVGLKSPYSLSLYEFNKWLSRNNFSTIDISDFKYVNR